MFIRAGISVIFALGSLEIESFATAISMISVGLGYEIEEFNLVQHFYKD